MKKEESFSISTRITQEHKHMIDTLQEIFQSRSHGIVSGADVTRFSIEHTYNNFEKLEELRREIRSLQEAMIIYEREKKILKGKVDNAIKILK